MTWRRPSPFFLLFAGFILLRLAQALSGDLSFDDEEGFNLAAAWELLNGAKWPAPAYQLSDWENGSLIVVLLEVPLAALLGPVLLVEKLTGLLLASVTFTGLYLLGRVAHGRAVALLACTLFALFPGPLFHYSLTAHGFHPDSTGLQLLFLWRLAVATRDRRGPGAFILAGFLGGLAIYFAYISAVTVAAACLVLLVHSMRRDRRMVRSLVALAGGLLLGLAPLMAYNLVHQGAGMRVYGGRGVLDFLSPAGLLAAREETVNAYLHFSNNMAPELWAYTAFNLAYWATAAIALALPLVLRRRGGPVPGPTLEATLAAVTLATLLVTLGSGHPVQPWHLAPLITLLLLPLAAGAVHLWRRGSAWRLALPVLMGAVALAGVPVNVSEVRLDRLGIAAKVDGRNYPLFLRRMAGLAEEGRLPQGPEPPRLGWRALPLELSLAEEWPSPYPHLHAGDLLLKSTGLGPNGGAPGRPTEGEPLAARRLHAQRRGYALTRGLPEGRQGGRVLVQRLNQAQVTLPNHVGQGIGFGLNMAGAEALVDALDMGLRGNPLKANLLAGLAVGLGRGQPVRAVLDLPPGFCGEVLPVTLRAHLARGLGLGLSCRLGGDIPTWIGRRLCPALRQPLSLGARAAPHRCLNFSVVDAASRGGSGGRHESGRK